MPNRLYLVIAVLITSVLMFSCKEQAAQKKIDPKVVAAVVEKAGKTADALDNMNSRAFELGQVGVAMAEQGVAGAGPVLDEALKTALEARSAANKAALADYKAQTADWGQADLEQIAPALDRIEKATTRVWVIRSIAEGLAITDRPKAVSVLSEAAKEAEAIPDKKYRDLDLRSVSAGQAALDAESAAATAGRIEDPRVRAWALTEIGIQAKDARMLSMAADAAEAILKMEPSSELITAETPAATKEKVLDYDKAKLAASSAKALAAAAVAMNSVSPEKSSAMFSKAADVASGIAHPYTKAYAMSDVAMALAGIDPKAAAALAEKIESPHEDARFAADMKIAEADAARAGSYDEAELDKVAGVAKNIPDPFDRAKSLNKVCLAMVKVSKDKAAELAKEIEYIELKDEVLAAVAVASLKESDELAKKALDKINEPRFANASVLYLKGNALCEMGDSKAQADPATARKYYGKAASAAADAKSAQLQWKIAAGLCKVDPDKLFDMALKIEGDEQAKALSLSEIAAAWSEKGDSRAALVWDLAAKAAASLDDNAASCGLLRKVGMRCARYDKAKAAVIFGKATEKANKIGQVL
jgi:hypothetical protein